VIYLAFDRLGRRFSKAPVRDSATPQGQASWAAAARERWGAVSHAGSGRRAPCGAPCPPIQRCALDLLL